MGGTQIDNDVVVHLNVKSFAIDPVACRGDMPGWIHRHQAGRISSSEVQISWGEIQYEARYEPNSSIYCHDIATGVWRKM
jgi:hypothetical protein